MPERVLTQRELNRAVLARQHLLRRPSLSLPRALEGVAGLQTQYAPSGYVGLWSRVDGFARDDLTRALERRTVVQGTLMRITIHLVSARDFPLFSAGVREARRQSWLRSHRGRYREADLEAAAGRVLAALADGPRRRDELFDLVGSDAALWNGVGLWVDLIRAPPSGTWERRRADVYAAAVDWLGPSDVTAAEGVEHLVGRYLRGFGPAPVADIANWAGLSAGTVAAAVEPMRLRRFADEGGRWLLDLPRAPLPAEDTPAPVRFLPTWDATLLVHARRTGILPEPYRPLVFSTKTPHSVATFLVDGAVAGTWRHERGRVVTEPFARLSRGAARELSAEAERLAAFHA